MRVLKHGGALHCTTQSNGGSDEALAGQLSTSITLKASRSLSVHFYVSPMQASCIFVSHAEASHTHNLLFLFQSPPSSLINLVLLHHCRNFVVSQHGITRPSSHVLGSACRDAGENLLLFATSTHSRIRVPKTATRLRRRRRSKHRPRPE